MGNSQHKHIHEVEEKYQIVFKNIMKEKDKNSFDILMNNKNFMKDDFPKVSLYLFKKLQVYDQHDMLLSMIGKCNQEDLVHYIHSVDKYSIRSFIISQMTQKEYWNELSREKMKDGVTLRDHIKTDPSSGWNGLAPLRDQIIKEDAEDRAARIQENMAQ